MDRKMLLCCAVPMVAAAAILMFWALAAYPGIGGAAEGNAILLAMLLICPLMHVFMMKGGHRH